MKHGYELEEIGYRRQQTCRHNASQADLAAKSFITGVEMNWGTVYTEDAEMIAAGQPLPNSNEGGYDKNLVSPRPFGAGATEAAIAETKGREPIFVGWIT